MKTNERPNSDTRVDRQLRAGNAMYRGGYIAMIERQLAEARELIDEIETRHAATMLHTQAIVDDANSLREQRDRLADVLALVGDAIPADRSTTKTCYAINDDIRDAVHKALAAVKGGPQ